MSGVNTKMMKAGVFMLAMSCILLVGTSLAAVIYRCDTPRGPVYSDEVCGSNSETVELRDESSGVGGGPPEEVRAYLDLKRQERAEARDTATRLSQPAAVPVVVAQEPAVQQVAFWPGRARPGRPGRPGTKPRPEPGPGGPSRPGGGADEPPPPSTLRLKN